MATPPTGRAGVVPSPVALSVEGFTCVEIAQGPLDYAVFIEDKTGEYRVHLRLGTVEVALDADGLEALIETLTNIVERWLQASY
jgi:hypothetical protein